MNDLIRTATGRGGSDEKRAMGDAIRAAAGRGPAPDPEPPDPGEQFRADYAAVLAAQPPPEPEAPRLTGSADQGARSGIAPKRRSMSEHLRAAIRHHRRVADHDYWPDDA